MTERKTHSSPKRGWNVSGQNYLQKELLNNK